MCAVTTGYRGISQLGPATEVFGLSSEDGRAVPAAARYDRGGEIHRGQPPVGQVRVGEVRAA